MASSDKQKMAWTKFWQKKNDLYWLAKWCMNHTENSAMFSETGIMITLQVSLKYYTKEKYKIPWYKKNSEKKNQMFSHKRFERKIKGCSIVHDSVIFLVIWQDTALRTGSSWLPFWKGIVYHGGESMAAVVQGCLVISPRVRNRRPGCYRQSLPPSGPHPLGRQSPLPEGPTAFQSSTKGSKHMDL